MGKKAPSKSKLQKTADNLMSLAIRRRGVCELQMAKRCTPRTNLQHHHVVEKSRSSYLRYDFQNGLCVCTPCHMWWHNAGVVAAGEVFRQKFGAERWDYLVANTHNYVGTNIGYYRSQIEKLQEVLDKGTML